MNVLTGEIKEISLDAKINQEQETQINALIDLKEAIEELNINLQVNQRRNRLGLSLATLTLDSLKKNNMGRRKKESDVGMDLFSFLNIMTATIGVQTLTVIFALQIKPGVEAVQLLPEGGKAWQEQVIIFVTEKEILTC